MQSGPLHLQIDRYRPVQMSDFGLGTEAADAFLDQPHIRSFATRPFDEPPLQQRS
jgi:hypothetical protein